MKKFYVFFVLVTIAAGALLAEQGGLPSTAFIRTFLRSTTASQARSTLGVGTNGAIGVTLADFSQSYFTTNGGAVGWNTNSVLNEQVNSVQASVDVLGPVVDAHEEWIATNDLATSAVNSNRFDAATRNWITSQSSGGGLSNAALPLLAKFFDSADLPSNTYTTTNGDSFILISVSIADATVKLHPVSTNASEISIMRTGNVDRAFTIRPSTNEYLNGVQNGTFTLYENDAVTARCATNGWWVTANNVTLRHGVTVGEIFSTNADYFASTGETFIAVDCTAGNRNVYLPAATPGKFVVVKRKDNANVQRALVVTPAVGDDIDGRASVTIGGRLGSFCFIGKEDGTGWYSFATVESGISISDANVATPKVSDATFVNAFSETNILVTSATNVTVTTNYSSVVLLATNATTVTLPETNLFKTCWIFNGTTNGSTVTLNTTGADLFFGVTNRFALTTNGAACGLFWPTNGLIFFK